MLRTARRWLLSALSLPGEGFGISVRKAAQEQVVAVDSQSAGGRLLDGEICTLS